MTQPSLVLTLGDMRRLAGADTGALTLESGLAAFSDQNEDGERESHVLKFREKTKVSEKGDVILVGLTDTSTVTVHASEPEAPKVVEEVPAEEPKPKPKPKAESKK